MNRRKFLGFAGVSLAAIGSTTYLLSDNHNIVRNEITSYPSSGLILQEHEQEILYLASLAPSGHNTQPWLVKYVEPYQWIIGNDKSKWLPAVDPEQRKQFYLLVHLFKIWIMLPITTDMPVIGICWQQIIRMKTSWK